MVRQSLEGIVSKWTRCETARSSKDRLQDHPAVHDQRHETEHAAQDDGRDVAVLTYAQTNTRLSIVRTVATTTASAGQCRLAGPSADRADEFEAAEALPGFPRHTLQRRAPLAYLVEHEYLHYTRRSI
jgi:hypothetical protein